MLEQKRMFRFGQNGMRLNTLFHMFLTVEQTATKMSQNTQFLTLLSNFIIQLVTVICLKDGLHQVIFLGRE